MDADKEKLIALRKASQDVPTPWISEVVLQTNQFDAMKLWYSAILATDWAVETEQKVPFQPREPNRKVVPLPQIRACFARLKVPPSQVMTFGLFEVPELTPLPDKDPGLNHMQFKYPDLEALIRRVEILRDHGLDPDRSMNHGPGTSFYFRDPDNNICELCINNFKSLEETAAFIASPTFQKNPSGIAIDRDDFIRKFRDGIAPEELLAL